MVRLQTILESWKTVRADTAAAVEEFPEDLAFKATPDMDSFRDLALHILDSSHMLTGALLDGELDLTDAGARERWKKHMSGLGAQATKEQIAAKLREALDERIAQLASQPDAFWTEMMTRFDGQRVTRMELLQFVKEHELTHRAQLFFCLRLKGIVPATTRRRRAKK